MNQDDTPTSKKSGSPSPTQDARKERLAAALRDNLKRRKQQDRARKVAEKPDSATKSPKDATE